jgi:hypothetical protein
LSVASSVFSLLLSAGVENVQEREMSGEGVESGIVRVVVAGGEGGGGGGGGWYCVLCVKR